MTGALSGVRVVDVTSGPVGGMATMVLADHGADVVKVEPPGGDRFRDLPAAPLWLRGKRSVTADLATDDGRLRVRELVALADVAVVSGPPSRIRRWGLDADALEVVRPGLVHCTITGWGASGPLAEIPGYEGAVSARSGRMLAFARQLRRGGPVYSAVPVASHIAAQGAAQGILAGLVAVARGGGGQRVETSLLQALLPFDLVELLLVGMAANSGIEAPNLYTQGGDLPTLSYHPVRTSDGRWIQCGNLLEHLLVAFLDAIDLLGELLIDERFADPPGSWDAATVEAARERILLRVQERTADEWMKIFRANGNVAAEPYLDTVAGLDHPDVVGNGDVVVLDDPRLGPVRTVGALAELTATPAVIGAPAPRPGAHTDEVAAEWADRTPQTPQTPAATGSVTSPTDAGAPLAGITVVEFATIIAAPLSTVMLADLGARVIKVEPPGGDPYRGLVEGGTPAAKTTAGKSSICIDLKSDAGRDLAARLVAEADVAVFNLRPGGADRLGLGPEELLARHPGLVWVTLTGYGPHGPGAQRPATHPVAGAASGGATRQAGPAITAPCESLADVIETARQLGRANEANPDPNSAAVAATAVLLALVARERTGVGQRVHVNMVAANLYANADDAVDYQGRAPRQDPDPELHGLSAGYRLYPTADGWLFLAATTDDEWRRCWTVLGAEVMSTDPRFTSPSARAANDAALVEEISALLAGRSADAWEERFVAAGLAGVRADRATPGRFFADDPQAHAVDLAPTCRHTRFGPHQRWGPIVRVNGGLADYGPGVLAGEQTDDVLAHLGITPEEIADLRSTGVVSAEPPEWPTGS